MSAEFIPTQEQILTVQTMVSQGYNASFICEYIINKETEKSINVNTYYKAFKSIINKARKEKLDRVLDVVYHMALAKDINAVRMFLNLQGRGLIKEKFYFDETASIEDQYNQVIKASADGLIHAEEMTAYITAIKAKGESKVDVIIDRSETILNNQGEANASKAKAGDETP